MTAKMHTLYLSDQYLAFSDVVKGGLDLKFSLSLDEPDAALKFKAFLNDDSFGLFNVFTDVMGTETRQENIPHVTGKDRELLLDRKGKSIFPAADFIWKEHIKREKTARRDDVFLLIGITLPPVIKNILDILQASESKVVGVYSVPVLQQVLFKELPCFSRSLVISRVLGGGNEAKSFRQSFYRDGKLVISRVNNVTGMDAGKSEYDQLFDEVERTYQFLKSAKQVDVGSALKVVSLLTKKESELLFNHKPHYDIDFSYANFNQLAQKLGLRLSKPCSSLPEILANIVVLKQLKPNFTPTDLCKAYRIDRVKKAVMLSSVLTLFSAVIISSWLWYEKGLTQDDIYSLETNISNIEERRELLAKDTPETELPPKVMKQSIDLFDAIESRGHKPEKVLSLISRAYKGYHDLDIRNIVWEEESEKIEGGNEEASFFDELNAPKKIIITIRTDQALNTRHVLQRINDFSESLLSQPEIKKVEQEKSTIDIRSTAKLEKTFGRGETLKKAPELTLVITL